VRPRKVFRLTSDFIPISLAAISEQDCARGRDGFSVPLLILIAASSEVNSAGGLLTPDPPTTSRIGGIQLEGMSVSDQFHEEECIWPVSRLLSRFPHLHVSPE
jgi:hypothetical protein